VTHPSATRVLIALATYKERENLSRLLAEIHAVIPQADVLVIDDNSPDGTGQLADELASRDRRIRVMHRPGKLGLGTAILTAMHCAIEHSYDLLVTMDADFSHHPRHLPALLAGMTRNDVTIGSRYIPGGATVNWPRSRLLISRGVNSLARLFLRLPTHDNSGGYRCYRVSQLQQTDLSGVLSHGYSFQEEVLFRCWLAGARVGETPIVFVDRCAGTSKVDPLEMVRSLSLLCWLGLLAMFGYTTRRVRTGLILDTTPTQIPLHKSWPHPAQSRGGVNMTIHFSCPAPEGWPRRLAS
jgi:dolichol-phosphate mannosyltransferase